MQKREYTIGETFGLLTLLDAPPKKRKGSKKVLYPFRCQCGRITYQLRYKVCVEQIVKSCGCGYNKGSFKHGFAPASGIRSEYLAFHNARNRCTKPKNKYFVNYGGRGIEFRFASFAEFISCLGPKPGPKYTLERMDVNGHYEAGNVKWATRTEQAENTRRNQFITIDGTTHTQNDWAKIAGIAYSTIHGRIQRGYCARCSVFAPVEFRPGGSCGHKNPEGDRAWSLS